MDRRDALGLGLLAATALSTGARADTILPGDGSIASDPREVVALWPGAPPGSRNIPLTTRITDRSTDPARPDRFLDQVGIPNLIVARPEKPNGAGVIIAPGGAYLREALDLEGFDIARHLNAAGITAFVLRYRLPGEGWDDRSDVPLQDAQRAMRLVRLNAASYGVDPARLGFMGFSAGGHVGASIATRFAAPVYQAVDLADALEARPAFAALLYPVVTMGEGTHAVSRANLLGDAPTLAQIAAYSVEKNVPADAPPSFICLAADDKSVPPFQNGIALFGALQAAKIPSELHVFEQGGHGFGIAKMAGKPGAAWPGLFLGWGKSHGFWA